MLEVFEPHAQKLKRKDGNIAGFIYSSNRISLLSFLILLKQVEK